jgi:hypothetical protein
MLLQLSNGISVQQVYGCVQISVEQRPRKCNGDYPCTDLAVPIMRYAEVILIKAEALLMSGQNADQEINMIRKRAGLAPKNWMYNG